MTFKVAPDKSYEYEVYFSPMLCRWFAKFTSPKFEYSFDFPLSDIPHPSYDTNRSVTMIAQRPELTAAEETILALVFAHMLSSIQAAAVRSQMLRAAQTKGAPAGGGGAAEIELLKP